MCRLASGIVLATALRFVVSTDAHVAGVDSASDASLYTAFTALYCLGHFLVSDSYGGHTFLKSETICNGLAHLCTRGGGPTLGVNLGVMGESSDGSMKAGIIHSLAEYLHEGALVFALEMSARKQECIDMVPAVMSDPRLKDKRFLIAATNAMQMKWLYSEILNRIDFSEGTPGLYLTMRKCLLNGPNRLTKVMIKMVAQTDYKSVHGAFKRLFLDVKGKDRTVEIWTIQSRFSLINEHNLVYFLNDELVFVIEYLADLINGTFKAYKWRECDIEFLVRRYCDLLLPKVPVDRLRACLLRMLENESGNIGLIPVLDYLVSREDVDSEQDITDAAGEDHMTFIDVVQRNSEGDMRAILGRNPAYMYNKVVLRWILKTYGWSEFVGIVADEVSKGCMGIEIQLDEHTHRYLSGCGDVLDGLRESSLTLVADGREVANICDTGGAYISKALVFRLAKYDMQRIDLLIAVNAWCFLECLQSTVHNKAALNNYIASFGMEKAKNHARYVCRKNTALLQRPAHIQ